MSWVGGDLPNREQYLAELMEYVRLPLLSQDYLIQRVEEEPLLKQDTQCKFGHFVTLSWYLVFEVFYRWYGRQTASLISVWSFSVWNGSWYCYIIWRRCWYFSLFQGTILQDFMKAVQKHIDDTLIFDYHKVVSLDYCLLLRRVRYGGKCDDLRRKVFTFKVFALVKKRPIVSQKQKHL